MIYVLKQETFFKSSNYILATLEQLEDWLKEKSILQVDTETEGSFDFKNKLLTIQIGTEADQWVIVLSEVLQEDLVAVLKPVLQNKGVVKILHNAKFDYKFFKFFLGITIENVYDTMLAEALIHLGKERTELSLEALCFNYCRHRLNKSIRNSITSTNLTDEVLLYAADDVKYLETIRLEQLKQISNLRLQQILALENEAVLALADIEYNGMKLDTTKWEEVCKLTENARHKQTEVLDKSILSNGKLKKYHAVQLDAFDPAERTCVNWASPKQVLNILNDYGIPLTSTNERFLTKFRKDSLVKELLVYRKNYKLSTSFGKNFYSFINAKTRRIHPDFWQMVSTGRISCSEPNLLNIPKKGEIGKKIRACFIPEDGYKIVGGDFSGKQTCPLTA